MHKKPKIVFVGAGSTVFAKNMMGDVFSFPALSECRLCLFDLDRDRLALSEQVGHALAGALGAHPSIEATTDRERALDGADYAVTMIQVGGYRPCTVTDFEIPKEFGLRQTIGDTLGIGGIMRALRTVPVMVEMCRDMERLCPDVLHLNYANPMAMICWGIAQASSIRTVGLCHSVQGTIGELAADLGVPAEEMSWLAAGINHMAFYLRLEHRGEDLYPQLRRLIAENRVPGHNRVRYHMLERLGYFVTESSEHFSEYVPWFIKKGRDDLIERFNIPLDEYPRRCESQIADWNAMQETLLQNPAFTGAVKRSPEYCSQIINSVETGEPSVIYGNVPNRGRIENLPPDCIVEVPCLVDGNGVQPAGIGRLPVHLAALIQTNVNVQALTAEALRTGNREHVHHAAMLDPHTAAELDLDQIRALTDRLIDAHGDWIPATFHRP